MRYDYGRIEQGTSFEFNNFYGTLVKTVAEVIEFDFMTYLLQFGRDRMNALLLETAWRENPDLIFFVLFTDEIFKATISKLSQEYVTFNWFCDDHWRFNNYSKHYAPNFSYVSTTDERAVSKYAKSGYRNALLTQWGCNHFDYQKFVNSHRTFDVTFVGQPHGNRRTVVASLLKDGISVQTFGKGWKNGRISQDQMIRIFNTSKINLNLANSSVGLTTVFSRREQIKGRNFEIPGCGGFMITNEIGGIEKFYEPEKEIVCFRDTGDLERTISYYLSHEQEREMIALRGYERTLRDHTYHNRFTRLFGEMGFAL